MPTTRISREITVADSKTLDSFSKVRVSEPSDYTYLDFRYIKTPGSFFNNVWDTSANYVFSVKGAPIGSSPITAEFSTTNNSFIVKNTNVSGFGIAEVRSRKIINIVPYSTVHAYISFKLENLTPLVAGNYVYVGIGSGVGADVAESINGFIGLVVDVNRAGVGNPQGYSIQISRTNFATGGNGRSWVGREDWYDKLDGSGPSGITIDFTKIQVLAIKYETSRSGKVTIGFMIGGEFIEALTFTQTNNDLLWNGSNVTPLGSSVSPFWSNCVVNAGGRFIVATTPSVNVLHCYGGVAFREESPEAILPKSTFSFTTSHTFPAAISLGVTSSILEIQKTNQFGTTIAFTTRVKTFLSKVTILSRSATPFYWEIIYGSISNIGLFNSINATNFTVVAGKPTAITSKPTNSITIYAGFCAANETFTATMPESIKNVYELQNHINGGSSQPTTIGLIITPIGGTISANEVSATFTIQEIQL
jgi:hypothetical protein